MSFHLVQFQSVLVAFTLGFPFPPSAMSIYVLSLYIPAFKICVFHMATISSSCISTTTCLAFGAHFHAIFVRLVLLYFTYKIEFCLGLVLLKSNERSFD